MLQIIIKDSKGKLRTLFLDESYSSWKKNVNKIYTAIYGPAFLNNMQGYLSSLPASEFTWLRNKRPNAADEELLYRDAMAMEAYLNYLDRTVSDLDRGYELEGLFPLNTLEIKNGGGKPNSKGVLKGVRGKQDPNFYYSAKHLNDLIKVHNLTKIDALYCSDEEPEKFAVRVKNDKDGKDETVYNELGGKLAFRIYGAKKDILALCQDLIPAFNNDLIYENKDVEVDASDINSLLAHDPQAQQKYLQLIGEPAYSADEVAEILEGTDGEFIKSTYDSVCDMLDIGPELNYNETRAGIGDSKASTNGIKFVFNYENSYYIKDGVKVNYFAVDDKLRKMYNNSGCTDSYKTWLKKGIEKLPNILEDFKKGDKKMKDSLAKTKFRFKDGTVIEVLESDGKNYKEVKDEAIKVHKQFLANQLNDSIEEKGEEAYEVTVNGKLIGTYATLEEAQEAEKEALAKIEKGIPKPTTEDSCQAKDSLTTLWFFVVLPATVAKAKVEGKTKEEMDEELRQEGSVESAISMYNDTYDKMSLEEAEKIYAELKKNLA